MRLGENFPVEWWNTEMNQGTADMTVAPGTDFRIEISQATKSFPGTAGETVALDDVSLDVAPGQFVALLGPSGCGKTTLLNLVAGLSFPDEGQVLYDGSRVAKPNSRVGYLTQDDALLPWRSVRSNIALPLEIAGVSRAERDRRTDEFLQVVGLSGFGRHYPHQLSGGMRKRVSLARTLIYEPETLLLDEPFGALDAQTRVLMQRELLQLVERLGLTVLFVTHDLSEAISLADRIVLFSRRPARIIESLELERRSPEKVGERDPEDDKVHTFLWHRLEQELSGGVA